MGDTRSLERLLPCPFCGKSDGVSIEIDHNGFGSYRVKCGGCSIQTARYQNREAAVSVWNRRTQSEGAQHAQSGVVELLEQIGRVQPDGFLERSDDYRHGFSDALVRYAPVFDEIRALATPSIPATVAESELREAPWVIRKSGEFYRSNRSGYTVHIEAAGIYTREEAEREARIEDTISAHPLSEYEAEIAAQRDRAQMLLDRLAALRSRSHSVGE